MKPTALLSHILSAMVLILLVAGCGSMRPVTDPALDKKASERALAARSLNRDVKSSKGTGWVTLEMDGRKDRFRVAWAVKTPNRARITLLASGIPFETIAGNGKSVTFFSHTHAHGLYTAKGRDPDLKQALHIRIRLSQIVSMLLGQIPLGQFDDAWFSPEAPDQIILRQGKGSFVHVLDLDPDGTPRGLIRQDGSGNLVYDIQILSVKRVHGRDMPVDFLIRDRLGRSIRLILTQFIPNPPIKESVFVLTEPGS
ncbi:LolA family protein [Desulfospira joergensenii]|uniref:LolA family protein n=1 Tax=Desulfospira joergensenii TaxID=53329 RepID=UPI0003B7AC95|nr:hypothetical protein [Desulfospira joergensenii]